MSTLNFAQVEFCDNLIFRRRAALDKLGERLLDANRTIGQPNKITTIFGRKVTSMKGRTERLALRRVDSSRDEGSIMWFAILLVFLGIAGAAWETVRAGDDEFY